MKKIPILILSLFCTFFMVTTFIYFKILTFNDISIEQISDDEFKQHNGVYLVSYSDGPEVFTRNQNTLVLSALNKGIDFFLNYKKRHLSPDFVENNKDILNDKRGAGLWLWKPYIILDALKKAPEGAVIIYCDVGFVFTKSMVPLIKLTDSHDITLVEYDDIDLYGVFETHATTRLMEVMNCDNKCKKSHFTMAGFMVLKNNKFTRKFIREWLELCQNKNMIMGMYSKKGEHNNFKTHQFDQTLLNALRLTKYKNINNISHRTLDKFASWHHRSHKNKANYSLIPFMKKHMTKWQKKALNLAFIRKIRGKLLSSKD